MMNKSKITEQLIRFQDAAEMLIYDLDAEVNHNRQFCMYFDAADILNAIEGASIFYNPDVIFDDDAAQNKQILEFKKNLFDSPRTLVNCLAVSGMLGKIHLLPPHQGELSAGVKSLSDTGTTIITRPDKLAERFLQDTDFYQIEWEKIKNKEFPPDKLEKMIADIPASQAKNFFKTVQSLQPWHSRLIDMINEGLLETVNRRVHYQPAGMMDLIFNLKEALDSERRGYASSNITDSLAMGALIEKVNKYQSDEGDELPCYFVSEYPLAQEEGLGPRRGRSAFRKVATSPDFAPYFMLDEDRRISAIRDDEYFILRAIFIHEDNLNDSLKKLSDWIKEIEAVVGMPGLPEYDDEAKNYYRNGSALIENVENNLFFKEVWIPSEAPKKFSKAVKDVVDASESVKNSEELKEAAKVHLESATKNWDQQADMARNIKSIWNKMETRLRRWKNIEKLRSESEIFKQFGFFRYSFPDSARDIITSHLLSLLHGGDDERKARQRFLAAYIGCLEPDDMELKVLVIVISTLLVMQEPVDLKRLLGRSKSSGLLRNKHFSFKVVYGEALLRAEGPLPREEICNEAKKLIEELLKEAEREKDQLQKARILRGVAYLYYWLWVSKGGQSQWRNPQGKSAKKSPELEKLIEYTILYAKESYHLLIKLDARKLETKQSRFLELEITYALNMYLYHMAEDEILDGHRRREMEKIGEELEQRRNKTHLWQYRFDDTLAVHYAKMTLMTDDPDKREELIGFAEKRVASAVKQIVKTFGENALDNEDRDVQTHQHEISDIKTKYISPQIKRGDSKKNKKTYK
jgi:hypothetical protein